MWKRQRLFYAKDLLSLMHPNFTFCRILGILPYKINASAFETSKTLNILRTFLVSAFCIYELIIFYKIVYTPIGDTVHMFVAACYITFGGFIIMSTYILSGPRVRVLQAVLSTSSGLSPESYRKLFKWIHVKDILGTFLVIAQGIMNIYSMRNSEWLPYYILAGYIELLVFQVNMLYVNCVCMLKTCFKAINDNLVHLVPNVATNDARCVPRFVRDTQENKLLLIELKSLQKQHLMISNTFQTLNVTFSLQLLATVTLIFIKVTFIIYHFIFTRLLRMNWSFVLNDEYRDVYILTNAGYQFLKLTSIVWVCHTGKDQAFKIGITVHDVLNSTGDKQMKQELYLFSLQVLHCVRNTFTMKGFTMDATLLAAIIGSITTYVLILAQFLITMHSCDKIT